MSYTVEQIAKLLDVSPQRVHNLAQQHGWGVIPPQPKTFAFEDVYEYFQKRWRRDLARQMGVRVKGLVSHDEWDMPNGCPVCGEFAIWRPASLGDIQDANVPMYQGKRPWLCTQGHKGGSMILVFYSETASPTLYWEGHPAEKPAEIDQKHCDWVMACSIGADYYTLAPSHPEYVKDRDSKDRDSIEIPF